MQKISGIIPSSARVSNVDMKEAPPVRPGTPGFGRMEGISSLRDRASGFDAAKADQGRSGRPLADEAFQAIVVIPGRSAPETPESSTVLPADNGYKYDKITDTFKEKLVDMRANRSFDMLAESAGGSASNLEDESLGETAPYPKGSFVDVVA